MQEYYWLICGIILIISDTFIFSSVFIFTFGIASLIIAALVFANIVACNDYILQFLIFNFFICVFFIIIFLKRKNNSITNYKDIIGSKAIVYDNSFSTLETGKLKWSGTIVKAKISYCSSKQNFNVGDQVEIVSIEGNIFYIREV